MRIAPVLPLSVLSLAALSAGAASVTNATFVNGLALDGAGFLLTVVALQTLPLFVVEAFTAGALAYPTDWHLHEKLGQPLAGIHAPVPGFAVKLAAGVDHVFDTLTPARLLTR